MRMFPSRIAIAGVALLSGLALAIPARAEGPKFLDVASSGKSLVIPEAQKSLGTIYYASPNPASNMSQFFFDSDAGGTKLKGQSNGVIGYAIAGPTETPAALRAGEWRLPLSTIHTGAADRDEQLQGAGWLDAAKFPTMHVVLKEVKDVKPVDPAGQNSMGAKDYSATLVADFTLHGVTKTMTLPNATIRFLTGTATTSLAFSGDLMQIKSKFNLALNDFGVGSEGIAKKALAEVVPVTLNLGMYSVEPEKQPQKQALDPAKMKKPEAPKPADPAAPKDEKKEKPKDN